MVLRGITSVCTPLEFSVLLHFLILVKFKMTPLLIETLSTYAAYADLSGMGLIAIQGDDTQTFLQGQFTNDVRKLAQHNAQYSGLCSPKGRLVANFLLWQQANSIYLQLPVELQPFLQKRLSMYILRSKVQLHDAHGQWRRIGVAGRQAAAAVKALTGCVLDEDMTTADSAQASVIRFSSERYQISVPVVDGEDSLAQIAAHAHCIDSNQWQWLEIQAGVPSIVTATQEQFVPQMVNFDLTRSVDFQKGCYTGQEIVARTQYLGKLKRRMYLVHGDTAMAAADEIYSPEMEGQASGMVVNAQPSPLGGWDALAVVQISSVHSQPLRVKAVDGALLSVRDLPYPVA